MTTNKQNLLDKIKSFYKNNKKASIVILVVVIWLLLGIITVALIGSGNNDSNNNYSDSSYDENYICNNLLSRGDKDSFHSPNYMIDGKVCSEIGYEWTDEAEAIYQKNRVEVDNTDTPSNKSGEQNDNQPAQNAEDSFNDALRKCTVMEAADIHTTGIGAKSNNVFNDGRDTCNSMFNNVYGGDEAMFISDVKIDWDSKKDMQIDGKDLTYYLSILGW